MNDIVARVADRIEEKGMSVMEAANGIGVTPDSLSRHLAGAYVRSDSVAKYRRWLDGDTPEDRGRQLDLLVSPPEATVTDEHAGLRDLVLTEPAIPRAPYRVVDLFCGCGGLSLGFDLAFGGKHFSTVLGVDIEGTMVDTLNNNMHGSYSSPVGRIVNLADFINDTEVRAFYLDHVATVEGDHDLSESLSNIPLAALPEVIEAIRRLDHQYLLRLQQLRETPEFSRAYASLDSRVLGQTSVRGFHDALSIPLPSARAPDLLPLIWTGGPDSVSEPVEGGFNKEFGLKWLHIEAAAREALDCRWEQEMAELERRGAGSGRGQLASSARRITGFLEFAREVPLLKRIWLDWRSRRDALRFAYFEDEHVREAISAAYTEDRRAAVVLGGPPCQGFSRIGRGKIRSLRDDRVQVHYDAKAGDLRNRLFEKYVLFVGALAPSVFLFENVRHFQTEVRSPEGSYLATEVLAEAVRSLSEDGLEYVVESQTVLASDHGIPQARDRFFMIGVRSDLVAAAPIAEVPQWILALPKTEEVPLRAALDDLPDPYLVEGVAQGNLARSFLRPVSGRSRSAGTAEDRFRQWIHQVKPDAPDGFGVMKVDAHVARDHRADDRALFALMGPGTRWMDYRCDASPTLEDLSGLLDRVTGILAEGGHEELRAVCEEMKSKADGSLSLRLLLECMPKLPGEVDHHLAKTNYLKKRGGNHGDWLARLDPNRPSRTIVTHMGKDTYAFVHPWRDGSLSVREAARIQTFPDWFSFGHLGLVDAFRVIGNAVPPLLSGLFAERVAQVLAVGQSVAVEAEALAG
jgi:site-specific DNA-cytosine methylase